MKNKSEVGLTVGKKIVLTALAVLTILFVAVGTFIYIQIKQMQPDYNGRTKISGIREPVTISWDSSGVVHIQGNHIEDVIFASGFTAAKERLWQMEVMRRVAKGNLSEIFGDTTVKIDRLFLTVGIDTLTKQNYQVLSQQSKKWLQLYADGINAYLETVGDDLPIEFLLLRMKPKKWSPQDCLLQHRIMAWFLNFNWKADLFYWKMYSTLSPSKFKDILPKWRKYPDIIKSSEAGELLSELWETDRQARQILGIPSSFLGSNNWVVSPKLAFNNHAMLANDPHLALQLPSIWIEMHLRAPGWDVAGFSLPGTPGIIIGKNRKIAWGVTNGMVDDSDYFIEKVDTIKKVYQEGGQEKALQIRDHVIKVKNKSDIFFSVYTTEHGPVFNGIFPKIKLSRFISLRWIGREKTDELMTFIHLMKAKNWEDFEEALQHYTMPAQNFVYADVEGNIGYRLGGKVPIRSYKTGLLPVTGYESENKWKGWIRFEEMPRLRNPERGWIATANNRVRQNYPYYLSDLWEPPYRIQRIEQLIRKHDSIKRTDMQNIQLDVKNLLAEEVLPAILAELNAIHIPGKLEEDVLSLLDNWNFEMDTKHIAPSVYEVMQYKMIKNIFQDEMGKPVFRVFTDLPNFYLRIFSQIFGNEQSSWFDNIQTDSIENRSDIIQKSFKETINYLQDSVSTDMEDWYWGNIHTLELKHTLGRVSLTKIIFNRGPFPVPGSGTTVNVGAYQYKNAFKMAAGASMRFLVDWGKSGFYWSVVPGGNSGSFLSPFYDNQIEKWRRGGIKKVNMRRVIYNRKQVLEPITSY